MLWYTLSWVWWLGKGYLGGKIWNVAVLFVDGKIQHYLFSPKFNNLQLMDRGRSYNYGDSVFMRKAQMIDDIIANFWN